MKTFGRSLLCLGVFLLVAQTGGKAFGIGVTLGGGGIDYDGTGTITHMAAPFSVHDVYGSPGCVPFTDTVNLIMTQCHEAVNTSLSENGIFQAQYLRIQMSSNAAFTLTFGCASCSSSVSLGIFDLVPNPIDPVFGSFSLTESKINELQALINQYGADMLHFRISAFSNGGFIDISSAPIPTPEPASLILFATSLGGLAIPLHRRRKFKRQH
jgi:hypothetical protein